MILSYLICVSILGTGNSINSVSTGTIRSSRMETGVKAKLERERMKLSTNNLDREAVVRIVGFSFHFNVCVLSDFYVEF